MNKRLLLISSLLSIASCGGGSGSSGDNNPTNQTVLEGVFIDSPVMGLAYSTVTQSGVTDSNGTFRYLAGETVSFSLGGIEFGSAIGADEITPLNLVDANNIEEATSSQRQRITNMLVLLQSLDADQNPDNGIDLANLNNQLSNESLDFDTTTFEFKAGRFLGLVAASGGRVVDETSALNHFLQSTDSLTRLDLPVRVQIDFNADGVIDSNTIYEYTPEGQIETATTNFIFSGQESNSIRSYEYNNLGLLERLVNSSIQDGGSNTTLSEQSFSYNSEGQLVGSSLIIPDRPTATLVRSYDEFGRLSTQELRTPALSLNAANTFIDPGSFSGVPLLGAAQDGDITGFRLLGPISIASLLSAAQAPLDVSVPSLRGNSFFVGNIEREFSGHDIRSQTFVYSETGFVEQVTETESLLQEGAIEAILRSQRQQVYDSEGRLISSSDVVLGFQVESLFSFTETGRLESCSVAIDGEILVENGDPITVNSSNSSESYRYFGLCSTLFGTLTRFDQNGDFEFIETYIPAQDSPPVFDQAPRVSRQEFIFDGDITRVRQIANAEMPNLYTETTTSREGSTLTSITVNSQGEEISSGTTDFETFELRQLPQPLPVLNVDSSFAIGNADFLPNNRVTNYKTNRLKKSINNISLSGLLSSPLSP